MSRHRDDTGSALVETALILPLLALLLVGVMDASRAVWMGSTLAFAAREGARYAIVHGSGSAAPSGPGQTTGIQDAVRRYAQGVPDVSVTVTYLDGDNEQASRVQVEATAPFTPALSEALLAGGLRVTLRSGSTLLIHR